MDETETPERLARRRHNACFAPQYSLRQRTGIQISQELVSLYTKSERWEELQCDHAFHSLFARISGSQYIVVPPTEPSSAALLAVKRLRAGAAALIDSNALFNRISPDKYKLQIRHGYEHVNIYDSFQALINSPNSTLPKWSCLCLIRDKRLAIVWAYDIDQLKGILSDCKRMLSGLVCHC